MSARIGGLTPDARARKLFLEGLPYSSPAAAVEAGARTVQEWCALLERCTLEAKGVLFDEHGNPVRLDEPRAPKASTAPPRSKPSGVTPERRELVLRALEAAARPLTKLDLINATGASEGTLNALLKGMVKAGDLARLDEPGRATRYALPDSGALDDSVHPSDRLTVAQIDAWLAEGPPPPAPEPSKDEAPASPSESLQITPAPEARDARSRQGQRSGITRRVLAAVREQPGTRTTIAERLGISPDKPVGDALHWLYQHGQLARSGRGVKHHEFEYRAADEPSPQPTPEVPMTTTTDAAPSAPTTPPSVSGDAILATLATRGALTANDIAQELHAPANRVAATLADLHRKGRVERRGVGGRTDPFRYEHPGDDHAGATDETPEAAEPEPHETPEFTDRTPEIPERPPRREFTTLEETDRLLEGHTRDEQRRMLAWLGGYFLGGDA